MVFSNVIVDITIFRRPFVQISASLTNVRGLAVAAFDLAYCSLSVVTTATVSYIKGTSETFARILQPYNIRVVHKPIATLRQLLTNVKDKDEPNDRQGAVYKIKCCECQASYIGETGRNHLVFSHMFPPMSFVC